MSRVLAVHTAKLVLIPDISFGLPKQGSDGERDTLRHLLLVSTLDCLQFKLSDTTLL